MVFLRQLCVTSVSLLAILTVLVGAGRAFDDNWPRFRGHNGAGVSETAGIPTSWSPGDFAWNVELPGIGHSSPIVWGDRLFLTSAVDEGTLRYTLCLDTRSGETLWIRETGLNDSHKHLKSSWASATPATDGQRVFVAFADKESYILTAYDLDGELLWRRSLGAFESQHGQGTSPIVFEDLVIIANDQDGPSSVLAFDSATGETIWSALRSSRRTSYATPLIARQGSGEPQLICASGATGLASLDPYTGRTNWMTGELPARTVASPLFASGLVLQPCGGGGVGKYLLAVDPFKPPEQPAGRIQYERQKNLPYVPTPIAYRDHAFLWNDNGVVNCVETTSGKNVWTKRIGGNYSGSPVCIAGKLYIISEDGEVVVLDASPEFHLHGKMPLGDPSHSTPAVGNGRLFLRSFHRLACLSAAP